MRGADVARVASSPPAAAVGRELVRALCATAAGCRRALDDDCRRQDHRPRGRPRAFEQGLRSSQRPDKLGDSADCRSRTGWCAKLGGRCSNAPTRCCMKLSLAAIRAAANVVSRHFPAAIGPSCSLGRGRRTQPGCNETRTTSNTTFPGEILSLISHCLNLLRLS
jgi:hypothetical protein